MVRLRVNRNRSPHEFGPLIHAHQTHASALSRCSDFEALARIFDFEVNFTRPFPQSHFDPFNSTVLDCVVERSCKIRNSVTPISDEIVLATSALNSISIP
jgi:hypothetical protein